MTSTNKYLIILTLLFWLLSKDIYSQNTNYQSVEQSYPSIKNYKNNSDAFIGKEDTYFTRTLDQDWLYKIYPNGAKNDFSYLTNKFSGENFNKLDFSKTSKQLSKEAICVYFTSFTTPQTWDFREFFIKIAPNNSSYRVYVNGQKAGENLDTKTEAIFNITKIAKEGKNNLVIESFYTDINEKLENHIPKNSGLNSVSVFSTPKVRLMDYNVVTSFIEGSNNANLSLNLILKTHLLNSKTVEIRADIYDINNNLISTNNQSVSIDMLKSKEASLHFTIQEAKKYSSHSPYLYKAIVAVSHENRVTERIKFDFGFKDLSLEQESIVLNGNHLKFYGANYYESDKIETDKQYKNRITKELENIKKIGFNSVRLKNSPQRESFYTTCDSIGLYIFDQANLNLISSGYDKSVGGTVAAAPSWYNLISERAIRQYHLSKNSLGLISLNLIADGSNGYNLYESFLAIKKINDKSIISTIDNDADWNNDILLSKYPQKKQSISSETSRPILLEITSSLSDNLVRLKEVIELTNSTKNISGFFIDAPYNSIIENQQTLNSLLESFSIEAIDIINGEYNINVKNNKTPLSDLKVTQTLIKNDVEIDSKYSLLSPSKKTIINIDYGSFKEIKDKQSVLKSKDYSIKISISSPTLTLSEKIFKLSPNR